MLPKRELFFNVPPNEVNEVDIRPRSTFHHRIDTDKRYMILQITLLYNVPADIQALYVVIQGKLEWDDTKDFAEFLSPLEN